SAQNENGTSILSSIHIPATFKVEYEETVGRTDPIQARFCVLEAIRDLCIQPFHGPALPNAMRHHVWVWAVTYAEMTASSQSRRFEVSHALWGFYKCFLKIESVLQLWSTGSCRLFWSQRELGTVKFTHGPPGLENATMSKQSASVPFSTQVLPQASLVTGQSLVQRFNELHFPPPDSSVPINTSSWNLSSVVGNNEVVTAVGDYHDIVPPNSAFIAIYETMIDRASSVPRLRTVPDTTFESIRGHLRVNYHRRPERGVEQIQYETLIRGLEDLNRQLSEHIKIPIAMSSSAERITRFREAMQIVYGDFETLTPLQHEDWRPLPNSGGHRGRYLWTDAFGIINFLTLYKESSDPKYLHFASRLIASVHGILGSTRNGNSRLPGVTEQNPLGGGLRIGKKDASGADEDGQYHHYLTIWMFALNRMTLATGDDKYNNQAISLAKAIHPHFFHNRSSAKPCMYWKISTDMQRPLVANEGNMDPINGFLVFRILQQAANDNSVLSEEIADYKRVMNRKGEHKVSKDALDLGMTLWISHWLDGEHLGEQLQSQCMNRLYELFSDNGHFLRSTTYRLAFREFGTCMGMGCSAERNSLLASWKAEILASWENVLGTQTPEDLRPITQVMYAAALIPGEKRTLDATCVNKHPVVLTTVLSVGSLFEEQVLTSAGVPDPALLILESTNLNLLGELQVELLTAGKLTLSHVSAGKYGFPEFANVCVTFVDSAPYTDTYVSTGAVHAVWEPEVPLKAMLGIPSLAASVAAPTVPDMRTVEPRFAAGISPSEVVHRPTYDRRCLPPTFGPATAKSGAVLPKYFGATVWIP
ncbi:MAG: hypothetical protein Q9214_000576, partial [Letrouitia sp. 1 TL-2023]